MSKYTITVKDNETNEETTITTDNMFAIGSTKINEEVNAGDGYAIGGNYHVICASYVTMGRIINETFNANLSEENKQKVELYRKNKVHDKEE